MEIDGAPTAEIHEDEPPAPREALVRPIPTDFSILQGHMDWKALEMREMRTTQIEILECQTAMDTMMREILGRLPPPPDAAP
jgi:hypothetical protein